MKFKLKEELRHNVQLIGEAYIGNAYSSTRYLYRSILRESGTHYNTECNISLVEGVDFSFADTNQGGTIVFSTDVNVDKLSENKIVNWMKQKIATINNRLFYTRKVDDVAQEHNLVGWTIGKGLSGRYTAKNGKAFGENSISVDIVGISHDELLDIATELCRLFQQETVLVKDYSTQQVYLVNKD